MLYIWILLALIGLLLYMHPIRALEGFQVPPVPNTDVEELVRKFHEIVQPKNASIFQTPDLGGNVPKDSTHLKSTPASPSDVPPPSKMLAQGTKFQSNIPTHQSKPIPTCPDISNYVPKESVPDLRDYVRKDSVPDLRKYVPKDSVPDLSNYIRKDRIPPPPQCPDMRDYIRKDSIPCWGCTLGK